tara:strand:- start:318 stop:548 length:231 start_codon:yes stop_codon:yes gene_type:complete
MGYKVAPLNSTFMLIAILGFLISVVGVYPKFPSWGAAFGIVFFLMFIASVVSATYGDPDLELKMDAPKPKRKKKKK